MLIFNMIKCLLYIKKLNNRDLHTRIENLLRDTYATYCEKEKSNLVNIN